MCLLHGTLCRNVSYILGMEKRARGRLNLVLGLTCCVAIGTSLLSCVTGPDTAPALPALAQLSLQAPRGIVNPLDEVLVTVSGQIPAGATLQVVDGDGRVYVRQPILGPKVHFRAAGVLGAHALSALDGLGRQLATTVVAVDCKTGLQNERSDDTNTKEQPFTKLLAGLFSTMNRSGTTMMNGKPHHTFVPWIRDHNHVLKSMKYFDADLLSGVDLYRDTQRADGMIWDNHSRGAALNHWDGRFADFNFVGRFDNNNLQFRRIPVEADVEYLYVEAMWHAWKATGDDEWLKRTVASGEKALRYSLTDPMRWSQSLKLVKRGYTIDTWDFQNEEDAKRSGDAMKIDPKRTRFGVMFGDNTGLYHSALLLAEMLDHVGNNQQAKRWRSDAEAIKQRLDTIAWNGHFYTHHVPEDASVTRDLGVNEKEQVSLSNAYSLNRGIDFHKRQEIIKTYQNIRDHLPEGSPGEWYTIYPTFKKGFGGHNDEWQYMNGGVVSIVAGELAHGAFEAGFEDYGVDILNRVNALVAKYGGKLPVTLKGSNPPLPVPRFSPQSLKKVANVALTQAAAEKALGANKPTIWTGDAKNDLPDFPRGLQTFKGVPFDILQDEAANGRSALGLSKAAGSLPKGQKPIATGYLETASLPVAGKAKTIYFLHASSNASDTVGSVELQYKDGSSAIVPVKVASDVIGWWYPEMPAPGREASTPHSAIAWEGKNASALRVGVTLFGMGNPQPERELASIKLAAAPNASKWMILGLTLSDQPTAFGDSTVSYGIPDNWGAAAVAYALLEGLAGVKDTSTKMQTVALRPRWAATSVRSITSTVKYPASQGYLTYSYKKSSETNTLDLSITGSGTRAEVEIYLPPRNKALSVGRVAKTGFTEAIEFRDSTIGDSHYATFSLPLDAGIQDIQVKLAPF